MGGLTRRSTADVTAPVAPEPHQLRLRFFARIDQMRAQPPERGLWRELLDLVLGTMESFDGAGRPVSAAAVWALGAAIYFRADSAGVVDGFNIRRLAADCRLTERTAKAALRVLRDLQVLRHRRGGRREPATWSMNLGGLDWTTVSNRDEREKAARQERLPLDEPSSNTLPGLSGDTVTPLSGVTVSPLKSYKKYRDPPSNAAATNEGEQQQQRRFEGLVSYIAFRHRELSSKHLRAGRPALPTWPEDLVRADFAAGNVSIGDLQDLADALRGGCIPGEVVVRAADLQLDSGDGDDGRARAHGKPCEDNHTMTDNDINEKLRDFAERNLEGAERDVVLSATEFYVADGLDFPRPIAELPAPRIQVGVAADGHISWVSWPAEVAA